MHLGFCSVVFLGLVYVASNVLGCSVLEPGARAFETGHEFETDDRKVYYTEVIVVGQIVRKVQGDYPFKGIKGVYTVEFKVDCTYKGGPVPETIFIAGIGNKRGQIPKCPPTPVNYTELMIMFLKPTGKNNVFEIEFRPNKGESEIMLDDLSINCGLNLRAHQDSVCNNYEPLSKEDGCVTWTPITPKPTMKPKVEPTTPLKPDTGDMQPEPTEATQKPVVDINGTDNSKNNQSDEGYNTNKDKVEESAAAGSSDNGNGSTLVSASFLATLVSVFLTLVV